MVAVDFAEIETAVAQRKPSLTKDGSFLWGVGIEGSALPHLDVDQFNWTQHNLVWQDDLRLLRDDLGVKHVRYSIPWHYMEPVPGRFDWSLADERIEFCRRLGIEVMLDVMHFGTPIWLPQAVGDPEFPEALERLSEAMAERYRDVVRIWCPFNEPLVTALFSGDFGFWPPHSRQWRGYFPVLTRIALATSRAIRAVRRKKHDAIVFICDAADHFKTHDESLRDEVTMRNLRRFLLLDLIAGRVNASHPLHDWMMAYGMDELDLEWFRAHPQPPDAIGLDYYPHSDWQLELGPRGIRQRRAPSPAGLYGVASDYYERYQLPMLVSETSIEGKPINREVWLERMVDDARRLREEGLPLLGMIWWPLLDHLDWDGALTHRIGKLHQVGLYKLVRQADGRLQRIRTPIATKFAQLAKGRDEAVGEMEELAVPLPSREEQLPPLAAWMAAAQIRTAPRETLRLAPSGNGASTLSPAATATPSPLAATAAASGETSVASTGGNGHGKVATQPGLLVFSHLRWGFVWQRPQQFLSRLARRHPVLFVEEPMFDGREGAEPDLQLHQVMPNVTVVCVHLPASAAEDAKLPDLLRGTTRRAMEMVNENGQFDQPLLWYYSPTDAHWTLGHFRNSGIIYDCMDELSQFTGATQQLIDGEKRLLQHADIVFTGGKQLYTRKRQMHDNVHFFGCGVEAEHFGMAMDRSTGIPPDIDFMTRPILGWFGVIDERVDYRLLGEMARLRQDWSIAMIGPVVKVDPNLLPNSPNLYWLGGRDYSVLPNYCRAFDVCIMPFAINDATEFINPTKALEYLATGRPVISTPVRDVVEQYQGLIEVASSAEQFVAAAERLLEHPDGQRIQAGLERARQCTWEATVQHMQDLIAEAVRPKDRRSAKPIEPAPDVQLQYKYTPTPGS